ncbi:nardilysin-like [Aphidius gifuensis]|uniref:nardilysin-like n=1 Tax=Aphidius gifuensis TaxID=684658 RepID=UPI001CDD7EDC|nr:nardilysin-like [Aphidius gifuensis]
MPKRCFNSTVINKKFKNNKKIITTKRARLQVDYNLEINLCNMAQGCIEKTTKHDIIDNKFVDIKVDYLDTPVKSENDKKDYKVIKLPNGLTALLIADLHDDNKSINCHQGDSLQSEDDESESDNSDDDVDSGDSGDSEEVDGIDNGDDCQKRKSSNVEEKMAACGLCVGVGSFSDPPEIPGMAHFLEHMVFMGSTKYPLENDFDVFIKKHGGSNNASTECEQTTFYFEINEKYLLPALDRFAQFFVSPLMLRDAITREREAVESEFQMALPLDSYRKEQLFCSFAEHDHPSRKFTWGNLVTLKDNVTEDKLYETLHEFRERHYSAHRMTVTIQARLPLDTLEDYVKKCFANVPCNNLPSDDFSKFMGAESFDTPSFKRIYKIKPSKDVCQIELTWAMPTLQHLYKSKPHQYVSWIIGHEGKGSLISYLRKKMWCLDIFSGNGESGFEHSSMYALFSISLVLTDLGHVHIKDVLNAVFSYINMLKKIGPKKRIYDEICKIEETNFRFADDEAPCDYVEQMCESMQFYPPIDYITGSELYFEYDPVSIVLCIEALNADNVNIIIFNKKFDDDNFEKIEPWFRTKYTDTKIPEDWINNWKTIEPLPSFHLPEPNKFVTDDFTLIPIENQEYPKKIHQDNLSEIWYKPDAKFRLPECYINYLLISPLIHNSPEGSVIVDLMVSILKQQLVEELYPATAAELNYDIQAHERGMIIKVWGFNQKLPLVLQTIAKYISELSVLVREDLFEVMKKQQIKSYYNMFLKPSKLNNEVRLSILTIPHWTSIDKHTAAASIFFDKFKILSKKFMDSIYIKCLAQGNMPKADVIAHSLKVFKRLSCKALLPGIVPTIRVYEIPKGIKCCRIKNFNPIDTNSVVTNYYQSKSTMQLSVIIEMIIMIMEEPLFNQLRTLEQLGYNVSCRFRDTYGVMGFSVTVCTQASKFSVEHIDNRIEEFLKTFDDSLGKMDEDELKEFKDSLLYIKQCADNHLKEELDRNWSEITSGDYIFDRLPKEVEAISKLQILEIQDWLKKHRVGGENFCKLTVQIVGNDKNESDEQIQKVNDKENISQYSLQYVHILENKSKNYCINDIDSFKKTLVVLPLQNINS